MDLQSDVLGPLPGHQQSAVAPTAAPPLPSAPGASPTHGRFATWAVCGLLLLAVWLAFGRSTTFGFLDCDDQTYVSNNSHVLHGLSLDEVGWAFTHLHARFWLPLVWISYMVDNQLVGLRAGGYHLTNVLLHGATAIGLFLVLRRMTGELWPSALAAALFAIHPLRAESVAWIAERKDVLNGLFFVLTLAAYAAYAGRPFSLWRYMSVVACFLLSLLAKPVTVTLPFVLLLLDYWPLRRFQRPGTQPLRAFGLLVAEKIPLLLLGAAFCALTVLGVKGGMPAESLPVLARLGNVPLSYVIYLQRAVWPVGLALVYDDPYALPSYWGSAACVVVLAAISWALVAVRRRHPYFLVGWLWYLVVLFPTSGIVPQGHELRPDRFLYLPHIGLAIALAWGTAALFRRGPSRRREVALSCGMILTVLFLATWRQTGFWADTETVWTRSLAVSPHNAMAHFGLGNVRRSSGHVGEALQHYELAIRAAPDYADAYGRCGDLLVDMNRIPEAIQRYLQAVRITPDDPALQNSLGDALLRTGRVSEALAHCERAARIAPDNPVAHYTLGLCLARFQRSTEALEHLEQSQRLAEASGHQRLAQAALSQIRRLREAQRIR